MSSGVTRVCFICLAGVPVAYFILLLTLHDIAPGPFWQVKSELPLLRKASAGSLAFTKVLGDWGLGVATRKYHVFLGKNLFRLLQVML